MPFAYSKGKEVMDPLMIKPSEAATLLGIGRTKIYQLIRANAIPSRRVGKSIRLPLALLKAWVETPENSEQLRGAPSRRK